MYNSFLKRLMDMAVTFILLIALLPLGLILTIILAIINKGNPFFFQIRPGLNEKLFRIIKFKTMNDGKDKYGNLLSDDKRLTRIGRFIRKLSLDEIPQLINVLIGDMSLVGPRPLLTEYLPLYNDFQRRRHNIKPGITGWAQVNGRNAISWKKKFELDVWYVDNLSFRLDLTIIYLTVLKVFKREGISQPGVDTALPFKGN